ncbi:immunoglobulin superfamily member 1-like [Mauremys mutica]|uniref:immunoglobulin superfamily member 1-like n=1 Tax=Mauremys mutica TaxID=74926 RepID=UPI001D165FCD|nr:immunoglobulin superfamily member 1-like [Mauremys mutica]
MYRKRFRGQQPSYPKPNISLRPSGRVTLGGAVTIRCECRCRGARVLLSKAGDPDARRSMDPVGDVVEFPIRSVSQGDAGNYSCQYSTKWDPPVWSEPSDPVELVRELTQVGPSSRIPPRWSRREKPNWVSNQLFAQLEEDDSSNQLGLEPSYPKPNISLRPSGQVTLGGAVTIRCECRCWGARVLLSKAGDPDARRSVDPVGDVAEFPIRSMSRRDAGSYSCQYSTKWDPPIWSEPSDPVELVVAEPSYPKPSISLQPSGEVTLGGAVTVLCWDRHQNMRFLLYKVGNPTALQDTEPAGDVAEFPIRNVSQRDAGSYSCRYSTKSDPPVWSETSDPVELVVAEPRYPKPNISLRPSRQVTLGGAVTIRCECRCRGARFLLSKAGDPDTRRLMDPAGDVAEFPIRNVRRGDAGSYSCQYSTKSNPPVWSEPSDPVELREPTQLGPSSRIPPQQSRREKTLVLFLWGEPTRPNLERRRLPPIRAARGQVLGLGGITIEPALETGSRCPAAGAGMGTVNLVAASPGRLDFTNANIARLVLGAMALLILGLTLAEAYYSRPREVP